ncbi:MAG: SDR family NAD(P)-dependent oxidoreductase [Hyphomicrobiales bacterium]
MNVASEARPLPNLLPAAGGTAMVTGAASGIGRAVALAFARAGVNVACVDRDRSGADETAEAARPDGGGSFALTADVGRRDDVDAMAQAALERLGRIDYLINCAGISERWPAEAFPEEAWDRIIDTNLKGVFLCCQVVGRTMIAQGAGRIVNMSSIAGAIAYEHTVAYLSSKGGLVQLTKGLAVEWGRHGISVNAIAPGLVRTPLLDAMLRENPARGEFFLSRMPISELIAPEDIAAAALFLCSPPARMITGHVLPVEGGYLSM